MRRIIVVIAQYKKAREYFGRELKSYENMKRAVCKLRICDIFSRLLLVNAETVDGLPYNVILIFCNKIVLTYFMNKWVILKNF